MLTLLPAFDAEYDDTAGEDGGGGRRHYEDLKKEVDAQTVLNRGEFEGMDDALRVQYEGFRPGMYVRMEVRGVPCELVTNFDPTYPLLVGGLQVMPQTHFCFFFLFVKYH